MSIQDSTNTLLSNKNGIATWLNVADNYIQAFNEDRANFVLPRAYIALKPIIESYANNLEGFALYVKGMRDTVAKKDPMYVELQALYRRVNGRYIQQVRRERSQRVVVKAEKLFGMADYHTKQRWVADLEHNWAQRRISFMQNVSKGKRLGMEERAEHLAEFWNDIDTEINNGEGLSDWN